MLYPVPTVWSAHPYIALNENGARAIDALMDEEIQQIAWEKHGVPYRRVRGCGRCIPV